MKSANAVVWQLDTDKLPDYPFDTKLTLDETAATVIHNVFFEHKRSIALQTAALQFVCLQLQQTHAESQQIQLPLPLTDHDKEQTLVTLIINYLQSHLDESVTIDKLAEQFKCSKSDITKSFRDERGKTPTQVLIQLRVKHAKDLLQNSDRTISQIAYACGYQDLAGFSHFFKKQTAQSPSEFRDNCHWLV
jgi:transcriptional regulator GlxA family with amidase domain